MSSRFPDSVVGFVTAFNGFRSDDEVIYLTASQNRRYSFPGVEVVLSRGTGPAKGDIPINNTRLYFPSQARIVLENLVSTRSDSAKTAGLERIEQHLGQVLLSQGQGSLNRLRDEARQLADILNLSRPMKQLEQIIGRLLGTRNSAPASALGKSIIEGNPYDKARVDLFGMAVDTLLKHRDDWRDYVSDPVESALEREVFAFFESFFSNYIEGTQFSIDEAREIVVKQAPVLERTKDSHDILGVYRLALDGIVRGVPLPKTGEFVNALAARHEVMMKDRPEVNPGKLKTLKNMAGNTVFVEPALVRGTLKEAAYLSRMLPEGFIRGVFVMVAITEVHPFADGNGRIARLAMNAELSSVGESRIIIPTLARDEYIDCLKAFSVHGDVFPILNHMKLMQKWSASFDYGDVNETVDVMRQCNAF